VIFTLHFLWKLSAVGEQGLEVVVCVTPGMHIHDVEYVYCNPTQGSQQCHVKVASLQ
jgi:hypothetical protein